MEGDTGAVVVGTTTLPAIPVGEALEGLVFEMGAGAIAQVGHAAVIDDDGTGADGVVEGDETDNRDTRRVVLSGVALRDGPVVPDGRGEPCARRV